MVVYKRVLGADDPACYTFSLDIQTQPTMAINDHYTPCDIRRLVGAAESSTRQVAGRQYDYPAVVILREGADGSELTVREATQEDFSGTRGCYRPSYQSELPREDSVYSLKNGRKFPLTSLSTCCGVANEVTTASLPPERAPSEVKLSNGRWIEPKEQFCVTGFPPSELKDSQSGKSDGAGDEPGSRAPSWRTVRFLHTQQDPSEGGIHRLGESEAAALFQDKAMVMVYPSEGPDRDLEEQDGTGELSEQLHSDGAHGRDTLGDVEVVRMGLQMLPLGVNPIQRSRTSENEFPATSGFKRDSEGFVEGEPRSEITLHREDGDLIHIDPQTGESIWICKEPGADEDLTKGAVRRVLHFIPGATKTGRDQQRWTEIPTESQQSTPITSQVSESPISGGGQYEKTSSPSHPVAAMQISTPTENEDGVSGNGTKRTDWKNTPSSKRRRVV
ncbi:hypothetical protein DB88DRAFT_62474 [Papiliotrema laurentii]|uniref:Uncharacterized protein n=1 Tax=Papiliotrema laurentii TaxID=5418 RepID=A0AAD9FXV6_PAPLA|nr:hypothetical protein DB88DRAFT_62474 [Papiliotrema laurentii]